MKILIVASALTFLFIGGAIAYFCYIDYKKHPKVQCIITIDGAPLFYGPGPDNEPAGLSKRGEVTVVGYVGNWWKMNNGKYIESHYLEPKNQGEYPTEL